ncbi:hypothetical protein [Sinomicrobium sp.]
MKIRTTLIVLFGVLFTYSCSDDDNSGDNITLPDWKAGDVVYSENEYVELVVGDIPLVITVPAGGSLEPEEVPDRDCPSISTAAYPQSLEIARAIQQEMKDTYGKTPFVVINHLKRTKLDVNREIDQGTCYNPEVIPAYEAYHDFIDTSLKMAVRDFGSAFFIDVLTHARVTGRLELAYSVTRNQIGKISTGHELEDIAPLSSMINLLEDNEGKFDIQDVVIGDNAFGTLMADREIASVPSKQDQYPTLGQSYTTSTTTLNRYAVPEYPHVSGVMGFFHRASNDTDAERLTTAQAFCESFFEFYDAFYPGAIQQ